MNKLGLSNKNYPQYSQNLEVPDDEAEQNSSNWEQTAYDIEKSDETPLMKSLRLRNEINNIYLENTPKFVKFGNIQQPEKIHPNIGSSQMIEAKMRDYVMGLLNKIMNPSVASNTYVFLNQHKQLDEFYKYGGSFLAEYPQLQNITESDFQRLWKIFSDKKLKSVVGNLAGQVEQKSESEKTLEKLSEYARLEENKRLLKQAEDIAKAIKFQEEEKEKLKEMDEARKKVMELMEMEGIKARNRKPSDEEQPKKIDIVEYKSPQKQFGVLKRPGEKQEKQRVEPAKKNELSDLQVEEALKYMDPNVVSQMLKKAAAEEEKKEENYIDVNEPHPFIKTIPKVPAGKVLLIPDATSVIKNIGELSKNYLSNPMEKGPEFEQLYNTLSHELRNNRSDLSRIYTEISKSEPNSKFREFRSETNRGATSDSRYVEGLLLLNLISNSIPLNNENFGKLQGLSESINDNYGETLKDAYNTKYQKDGLSKLISGELPKYFRQVGRGLTATRLDSMGRKIGERKPSKVKIGGMNLMLNDLYKGYLTVRYDSARPYGRLNKIKISPQLLELIDILISKHQINREIYEQLNEKETKLFDELMRISKMNLDEFRRYAALKKAKQGPEHELNQFEKIKAEILAGNNNPNLVKQLKSIVLKLVSEDAIPRAIANKLMYQITLLS